jgi:hypothetical protein
VQASTAARIEPGVVVDAHRSTVAPPCAIAAHAGTRRLRVVRAAAVLEVVDVVRPALWQTVTSAPPPREQRHPQWLSIYVTPFWLGSLARYRPAELAELIDGAYGQFLRKVLATRPAQLLYILTSEFKHQARAAVL